jgi:hypothetical protein
MDIVNILYLIATAASVLALVIQLVQQLQCQWKSFGWQPPRKPRGKVSFSYLFDGRNRRLQRKLLTLLHGNVATAKRLLKYQRQLHPGKSDNWYLEKVIHDLERDRR